jgi:hypothetical protein
MERTSLAPERANEDNVKSYAAEELAKIKAMRRKEKRRHLSIRHRIITKPHARLRSGIRTGTTPHFAMWMADLAMKSALQRTKTLALAEAAKEPQTGAAYAMAAKAGYRNVFDLSRASEADLLAIRGMGPVRLRTLKADLATNNVAVMW